MIRLQYSLAALFGHALIALAADAAAQTLEFSDALRAAEAQSPRLAAQRHALSAAGEQVARATELPDPKLKLGIENLPISGADQFRYDRDFMTMRSVGLMQEFPNSAKRAARGERAARLRDVEQANLEAQNTLLRKEAAAAWLEAYYAERVRTALGRLAAQFSLQIESVAAGIARGRQQAAEGYALRQVLEQANDRVIEQERAVAKARIQLAAWVGEQAHKPLGEPPDTSRLAHTRTSLTEELERHPQLQVHDQRENLARAEVDLARSSKNPDWSLEVGYGHRRPAFDNMLTVMLAFDLPWQAGKRQDRDIASRLAEVERARAEREDARRMHEAEVRGWLADFDTAQRRIERAERVLLPLARERRDAALAAYRGGRAELGAVLEAERSITEAELALVQSEAERARAWASLSFLFPHGAAR